MPLFHEVNLRGIVLLSCTKNCHFKHFKQDLDLNMAMNPPCWSIAAEIRSSPAHFVVKCSNGSTRRVYLLTRRILSVGPRSQQCINNDDSNPGDTQNRPNLKNNNTPVLTFLWISIRLLWIAIHEIGSQSTTSESLSATFGSFSATFGSLSATFGFWGSSRKFCCGAKFI